MVTIVSGSALGLQSSQPGTRTNSGGNVQGQAPDQLYVDSATNNLVVQDQDEVLSSVGSGLSIVRTYNSQGTFDDPSGNNWRFSFEQRVFGLTGTVNTAGSTITKEFGDGSQILYTYNATLGLYTSALGTGAYNTLSYNTSAATWTWTDGESRNTEVYNSSGQMTSSADTSGNVTTYGYTGSLVTQITDPSGQITYLDYSGNNLVDIREVSNGVTQKRVQYGYDTQNRLITVTVDLTPASGLSTDPTYVTTYGYQGTTDLLTSITQGDGTKVSLSYLLGGGSYRLQKYTDGNGNVTTFAFSGWAGLGATEPIYSSENSGVLTGGYGGYYTVVAGDTWASITKAVYWGNTEINAIAALQADMGNPTLTAGLKLYVPTVLEFTGQQTLMPSLTVTDALGRATTYHMDGKGRLTSMVSPTVGPVVSGGTTTTIQTNYAYDTNGNLKTVTQDPAGLNETTTYTYDGNGNLLSSVDAAGNTVTYTYSADNQLLTKTQYLVAATGTTAAASPITTRYAYDSYDRLRFSISSDGRVTENRYNAQGQRVSTLVYAAAEYNLTGLSASTALTLLQMTTWAAGQDQTQIERTDYTYDFRGNLSTRTVYTATSSTGAGAGTVSTTQYVYDQRGELLQVIDPRGIGNTANSGNSSLPYATTYTYDGLGRVLTETQWVSTGQTITTAYTYTASSNTIQTTAANGLVTTRVYDKAGHLLSTANSGPGSQALGTTTYQYDADGRLAITTDPTGITHYIIYDEAGRKAGEVDLSGDGDGTANLTQYIYDNADELVKTVNYADRLSAATVATLTNASGQPATVTIATLVAALPATVGRENDQITRSVYDAGGRKVYDIDAAGDVTQYLYDGAGRLTGQVQYATPVSIASSVNALTPSTVGATASPGNDRQTAYFYNSDGQLLGQLDAQGYLTQYTYDGAGQMTQKVTYATAAPSATFAAGAWSNLPAASPGQDAQSVYFYDAEGRRIGLFEVANSDGTGYFTQTQYDQNNNVSSVTQYDRALTYTAGTSTDATLLAAASAAGAHPHVTSYVYDGLNRLVQETNFEGTVTNYTYDNAGNLISQTVAVGSTIANDTRTTQTQYDALGRVTAQLSAVGSSLLTGTMTQAQIWAEYGTTYTYDSAGRRISQTVNAFDSSTNTTQTETTQYFYNQAGQLRFTMNALGEVTENQYDALGDLTAQISYYNRVGNPSALTGGELTSTALAMLTGIANAAKDKKTTYTYTLTGKVASQTSAEGASVTRTYNAFGEELVCTTLVDASQSISRVQNYAYDLDGNLLSLESDPSGVNDVFTYSYDAFGRQTSVTRNGNKSSTQYDALGRVIATIDPLTNAANGTGGTATSTRTTYDAFSRVLTTTDASSLNDTTTYTYNDATRSVTVTTPEGVSVSTVHNRNGQTLTVTSATNTTSYSYDLNGNVVGISDNLGSLESRAYDSAGREVTDTDARGVVTRLSYDAANRILSRTVDTGGLALTTTYQYDGLGLVEQVVAPGNKITATTYDRDGRITQVVVDPYNATTNPNGLNYATTYVYNNEGDAKTVTVTQGAGNSTVRVTQYTFDAMGRRTQEVVDPANLKITTNYSYDANGNLVHKIDANNNSTWYVYNADNQLHYTIDALGGITETTYDADGRVASTRRYATPMTPPASTVNLLSETQITPAPNSADRLERNYYDGDGREVYTIDAAGTVTQRTYDTNGDVIQLRVISTATPLTGTYANAAAVKTALGTAGTSLGSSDRVQWTVYDARGRAIFNIDALGAVTQTQYDAAGNVVSSTAYATQVTPPSTLVTSISASGQTVTVNGSTTITVASSGNDRTTRYWYDNAGRQVYSLTAAGSPNQTLTRTQYNDAARTQTVTVYAKAPTIPAGATTSDLQNGTNGVVITTSAGTTLSTGQVVGADQTTTTYYDAAGRVSKITDALNHSETYTYDAEGNRTSYTNKNGQTWTYLYDAGGRLIEEDSPYVAVTNVTGSMTSTTLGAPLPTATVSIVSRMTYDGLGNVKTLTEGIEHSSNGTEDTSHERVTTYGYDPLGRQTSVTLPSVPVYNGISTTEVDTAGSLVGANSTPTIITTQVTYNTLGDEIASRDAAGNYSYKAYDQLGRVIYEIDAMSYVTGYTYDAFGNKRTTTRYANTLVGSISGTTLTDLRASGTTITAINGGASSTVTVSVNSSQDRTVTTTYDSDNRATQVTQPAVFAFVPNVQAAGGQTFTAAPTTSYTYNAFGQVVRTGQLVNPNTSTWAYSYSYYDQVGNKAADVNADGYLTTYKYDAEGNLTDQIEYAQAVSGASISNQPAPTPSSNDRETQYQYDQLNRQVTRTLKAVQYTQITSGSGGLSVNEAASADAITYYAYDVLGNQTSVTANGATAYTYYDVLGHVIATIGPASNRGDGTTVTPLTLMQRDVYGNLVAETQYASGVTTMPAAGVAPTAAANGHADGDEDRFTIILRDAEGHALRTEQVLTALNSGVGNINVYDAYDASGNLVKEYQAANSTDTLVTFYSYDKLGRQTDVIKPQSLGGSNIVSDQYSQYNAFGEVTGKGTGKYGDTKVNQEFFYYDQAGRVYLTNTGDGVYRAYLYNLAGKSTGKLEDQWTTTGTSYDLSALSSQPSAANAYSAYLAGGTNALMFTQTRYDAMGNVVEERLPVYSSPNSADAINNSTVQVQTINGITYLTWNAPADTTLHATLLIDGVAKTFTTLSSSGNEYGYQAGFAVTGMSGTHSYSIQYSRPGDTTVFGEATGTFNLNNTTSLTISPAANGIVSGVSAVLSGSNLQVSWTADNTSIAPTFAILVGGVWKSYTGTINESSVVTVTLPAPAAGTYQYTITDSLNGVTEADGAGTITITGATTTTSLAITAATTGTVNTLSASVSGSTASVSWVADSGVTSASFAILIGGTWTTYSASLTESGACSVSFPLPAAGTYQYRITDLVNGVTEAQGTGTISFTAASSSTTTTGSATPAAVWYTPAPVSAAATVGTQGSGTITSSATPVQTPIRNESGQITGETDSWSGTDSVNLTWLNLAAGTYTVTIHYNTAANATFGIASVAATKSFSITGGSGQSFSWGDPTQTNSFASGGISSISYFQILQGSTVVRDSRNAGVTKTTISWAAPADTTYNGALQYRVTGTSTYTLVNATRSGSTFQVPLSELAPGTYDYIAEVFQNTAESPTNETQVSGQFVVAASSASISSQTGTPAYLSGVAVSGTNLTWAHALPAGDTLQVQLTGPSTQNLTPTTSNGTNYTASFNGIASGTYSYVINYIHAGATYLQGKGTISITTTTTTTPATASIGAPTQLSTVAGLSDLGNGVFGWTTAENAGDGVVFHYKASGASTWAGTLAVSGTGPFSVNLSSLSGSIDYEIDYTASGGAQPYRVGRGTVAINRTTNPGSASIGAPANLSAVSGFADLGSGNLGWTTAANSGDRVVFNYKASGAATWAGTLPVTGAYQVNMNGLSGSIDYEVDYIASGAAQPYRVGRGTITVNHATSGTVTDTTLASLTPTSAAPYELQTVDRWGNVTAFTDTSTHTTQYAYNRYNEVMRKTDPAVTTVSVAMTGSGQNQTGTVSTSSGPVSPVSHNYYDQFGRLIGTQDADGNINQQTENAANQVISEQHADGGHTSYVYDAFGDQIQVTTSVTATTSYKTRNAYDQVGRLTDTEQELVANTFTGAATGFANDLLPASNVNVIRNRYAYDGAGRRTSSTDGAGDVTRTTYDLHGNVISTLTPTNKTTLYGYDIQDRKTSETDPDSHTQSWTYDYFAHLKTHVDMGGATFTYTYDTNRSWLLTSASSTAGVSFGAQSKAYSYDTANHLIKINDTGVNSATYYNYDPYDRINHQWTIDDGLIADDTRTDYDAMGRISHLSGVGYSASYYYDAAGNRTHIAASYSEAAGAVGTQDLWYGYDAMNRVLISQGVETGTTIGETPSQGTILTYDWRGDRTSATTDGTVITEFVSESGTTYTSANNVGYYTYAYDGAARLTDTYVQPSGTTSAPPVDLESRKYDQASRITVDTTQFVEGFQLSNRAQTNTYNADGTLASTVTKKNGTNESSVSYSGGYDAAGNLTAYNITVYASDGVTVSYTSSNSFAYALGDSYLQTRHTVNNSAGGPLSGSTTNTYNVDQQLIQYVDAQNSGNNRYFLNNAQGQVLTVVQGNDGTYGSNTQYGGNAAAMTAFTNALISGSGFFQSANAQYFFYDSKGNSVGTFGQLNGGLKANFDVNFTPVSQQYPLEEPPKYVVEAGDTLSIIAMRVYGDASLWYIIAQANGLTDPNATLTQGSTLTIPNVVTAPHNNAQSFKPFDVSQALGDTTPTQPMPPPPHHGGGCGGFGQLLVLVVAIVVTIYTAGAAAEVLAPAASTGAGAFSTGLGVLTGTASVSTGVAVTAGAVGAAVGSVVSQGVGIAIGEQSSFNWGAVASAAVTGGIGAGLARSGVLGEAADALDIPSAAEPVFDAAVNSAANQAVDIALGQQNGFSWAAVAASAAAAPIANELGKEAGSAVGDELQSSAIGDFTQKLTTGEVNGIAYGLATGGKVNYVQVTADAFGNAIGNGIVQAEAGPQYGLTNEEQQQEYGDINASTTAAVNQDSKQIANAAGSSLLAQDAPLTDNLQLSDPEIQLQNITVDLNSVPLPAMPSIGAAPPAPVNDAFTRYWNDSVAQLTGGVSPSLATAFNQMLSGSGTSSGPQAGEATGYGLPPIEEFGPGYFETQANTAFSEAANPNNSVGQRAIFGLLGLATEPVAMVESIGRSIENAAAVTGQEVAQAQLQYQAGNTAEGNIAALGALEYGAEGFTVVGSLLMPGSEALASSPTLSEAASAIGNRVQQGFGQLSDLFAGSPGSIGNSGTPLAAQLGQLDFGSLVPESSTYAPTVGSNALAEDVQAANRALVFDHLTNQAGFSEALAQQHMAAIDFTQPVSLETLDPNTVLQQYVHTGGNLGNYFAPVGTTPLQSGLVVTDQVPGVFQNTESVVALKSVTAPDYLFPPGQIVPGSGAGGGVQYFIVNKNVFVPVTP